MPNMPDMPVVCEELNSISAVVDSSDFVDGQSCDNSNKQKDSQAKEIMETIPLSQNGDLVSSELKETTCSPTQAKIHEPVLHLEVNDCLPPEDASQNLKSSTDSQDKVDIPSKLALLPPSSLDDLSECDQTVTTSQQTCSNVMDAKPLEDATVVTQRNMESPEKVCDHDHQSKISRLAMKTWSLINVNYRKLHSYQNLFRQEKPSC